MHWVTSRHVEGRPVDAEQFSRLQKATALVPLARALGRLDGQPDRHRRWLPLSPTMRPRRCPTAAPCRREAIEAPASVPPPARSPRGRDGAASRVVATASTNGIPAAALAAYQRAETVINAADKSCKIPWQLIAAIGRVESDHGRSDGNTLDDEGVAKPGIYGIPLNGNEQHPVISDTDAGQYDYDTKYDRAVGPMQFIPVHLVGRRRRRRQRRQAQPAGHRRRRPRHRRLPLLRRRRPLHRRRASAPRSTATTTASDYVDLVLSIMEAYMRRRLHLGAQRHHVRRRLPAQHRRCDR